MPFFAAQNTKVAVIMGQRILSSSTKAFIALALVSFFWGTTYLATRIGVKSSHGFLLSAIRMSIAGAALTSYMLLRGHRLPKGKELLKTSIIGILLLGLGNGFMTWSLQYIESGFASVLSATCPIFIVIMSHFMIRPVKWSFRLVGGILVGFLGIVGIFSDYLNDFSNPYFGWGLILAAFATIFWCLGSVFTAKWKTKSPLLLSAGVQMFMGGVFLWIMVFSWGIEDLIFSELGWDYWLSILYLIIFGSFVAYSAYIYVMTNLPPAQASLSAYINPIVAVLLGALILSEKLTIVTFLSMGVTILGVYLVNSAFRKQKQKEAKLAKRLQLKEEVELAITE